MSRLPKLLLTTLATLILAAAATAQIKIVRKGLLYGSPRHSTAPATLDMAKAIAATPEGRRIADEDIERGTALYSILVNAATKRVRKAVRDAAASEGRDCVVKKGCIRRSPHEVVDLTPAVVALLES